MRKIFLLFYLSLAVCSYSQNSNFGVWTTIGAEKKINKKLSLDADLEMRTRDNIKSVDRWSGTVDMSYNLYKFIKGERGNDEGEYYSRILVFTPSFQLICYW